MIHSFRLPTLLLALMLMAGCATTGKAPEPATPAIGPYPAFSGRLLVIEPNRRWQVSIDWHAESSEAGELRLTHAATSTIIDLQWQQPQMQLRDSRHPEFRPLASDELAAQGIFLPPWMLASILLGHMPPAFEAIRPGEWQAHLDNALIRIRWQQEERRLTLSDISHGRQATLIIAAPATEP